MLFFATWTQDMPSSSSLYPLLGGATRGPPGSTGQRHVGGLIRPAGASTGKGRHFCSECRGSHRSGQLCCVETSVTEVEKKCTRIKNGSARHEEV